MELAGGEWNHLLLLSTYLTRHCLLLSTELLHSESSISSLSSISWLNWVLTKSWHKNHLTTQATVSDGDGQANHGTTIWVYLSMQIYYICDAYVFKHAA